MANTFHQLYVQAVFAVKYRASVIQPTWKKEFCGVIGNLINETGSKTIIVNGVEDHVHCFFNQIPRMSISDVMQHIKSRSSGWLNKTNYVKKRFEWQSGYGAFSYSHSAIKDVYRYIQRQEQHHQKQTFRSEYIELLERFCVEYDERYLFDDLI